MAKVSIILPKGEAVFPKLNEVDVYQPVDNKGRPKGEEKRRYLTGIKFNDEDHRKVDAYLKKQLVANDLEGCKIPWKKNKKDGTLSLQMTSGEGYPPPFFDSKGTELPRSKIKIGGGSVLKMDVTINPYTGFGGGINIYINSVQVIELKTRNVNRFETEEGGYVYNGDSDDTEDLDNAGAPESPSSQDMDDDIPF